LFNEKQNYYKALRPKIIAIYFLDQYSNCTIKINIKLLQHPPLVLKITNKSIKKTTIIP
jgi:hypothetical protein